MNKTWTNSGKGEDKIISIDETNIYKSNPKNFDLPAVIDNIGEKWHSDSGTFKIPLSLIHEIRYEENKSYIQVFFGGNEEHLRIKDPTRLKDIFDYFARHIPGTDSKTFLPGKLSTIKKPLIAGVVIFVLFVWTLWLKFLLETQESFHIYDKISSILLAAAELSLPLILLIFIGLGTIPVLKIYTSLRARKTIHLLQFKKFQKTE
ncbi:MAG: hypothetical protein ACO1O6_10330 [Bacteroidota bacterium]